MVRLVTSYSSSKIFWLVQWNMTNKCCSSSTSPIDLSEAVEFADAEIQCHGTTGSPFRTEKEGARWERYINLSQELQLNCSICQELWLNLTASWGLSRVLVGKFFFGRSFRCKKLQLLLPTVDLPASFSWKIDETVKADFAGSSTVALLQEQPTNNKQQPTKNKKNKKYNQQPTSNKQQTTEAAATTTTTRRRRRTRTRARARKSNHQQPRTTNHQATRRWSTHPSIGTAWQAKSCIVVTPEMLETCSREAFCSFSTWGCLAARFMGVNGEKNANLYIRNILGK